MNPYLVSVATSLSQFGSVLFGGHPDMTISSRTFVAARKGSTKAQVFEKVINTLFFWDAEHCKVSWLRDVAHASAVFQIQKEIKDA